MPPEKDDDRSTANRRPYRAPRVLESAEFETLALTCGKDVRGAGQGRGNLCGGQRISAS